MSSSFGSPGRRFFLAVATTDDEDGDATDVQSTYTAPRFSADRSLRDNVQLIAEWQWGRLRAEWVYRVAQDLVAAQPQADRGPDAAGWAAAILCAAAVDSGRAARPSTWNRALTTITSATGVSRAVTLEWWSDLQALGLERPVDLPAYWQKHG